MASKFIINDNRLIMSNCVEYHRELLSNHEKNKGGGRFYIIDNNMYMYDRSDEFGSVKIEDVKEVIKSHLTSRLRKMNIYFSTEFSIRKAVENGIKIKDAE